MRNSFLEPPLPLVLELAREPWFRARNRNLDTLVPLLCTLVVFKFRERLGRVLHIHYVPPITFQSSARLAYFLGRNYGPVGFSLANVIYRLFLYGALSLVVLELRRVGQRVFSPWGIYLDVWK